MESRSLLVSDVDGTLLGDDRALDDFADWYRETQQRVRLVYASGRFWDSVAESVQQTRLPQPDAIIGGVGTEIHLVATGENLDAWQRTFRDFSAAVVRDTLQSLPFLEPQPDTLQSPYKVSYYAHDLALPGLEEIRVRLKQEKIRAEIVYSSGRDLDVVPAVANKGTAARFLARHWDLEHNQMIVCGDSGNDLALFSHDVCGVVVANAQPELKALRGDQVYHCRRSFAAGVLEGVQFWLKAGQPQRVRPLGNSG